ncbi:MAG: capsular polysaccharide biosynthesis protein [Sedimentitalea sp.]
MSHTDAKAGGKRSRLFVYNGGFLRQRRVRRILSLAGYDLRVGLATPDDLVGIWGNSPTAHRGRAVAAKRNVSLLTVEDAFIRSLHPGRAGEPPLGLCLDRSGAHFEASVPSDLEQLLTRAPLDDTALLNRARTAITRLREGHLSKYNAFDPTLPTPDPGYVLVVDQTRGDASVTASKGNHARFREMLVFAQEEHPGARVLIKTHPETQSGHRPGYYSDRDQSARVSLFDTPLSPWALLDGAVAVYTLSSQLGFEAILAGHKPRVFGQPFYAGWGLSIDEDPVPRRERKLTRAQLFAAAMILYPTWYDPHRDQLCALEQVIDAAEAQARAWREDYHGWSASGMRRWKRPALQQMFGHSKPVRFTPDPTRRTMIWASKAPDGHTGYRLEDGFVRSKGLGAQLTPPLSLVLDRQGIYYDPSRPSDLEDWISKRADLTPAQHERAQTLRLKLIALGLSKYNTGKPPPDLPQGHRILVPGQVEDDASIRTGTGDIKTNAHLLSAVRNARPDAVVIYKPHPDVLAGLRDGGPNMTDLADLVLTDTDPAPLLHHVNEVWTLTSLLGFEALIRDVPVTTLGAPFYAGWGLTTDLGAPPKRRIARPTLAGLVHACLIDYPRYFDPMTRQACPFDVVLDRLATSTLPHPGLLNRTLSKLQGSLASYAHLWR